MKRNCWVLAAVAAMPGAAMPALASDVVFSNTADKGQYIDQQTGNNYYYIGDQATLTHGGQLGTISVDFFTTYYDGTGAAGPAFDYTPNLVLDVYGSTADAQANTNLLGSVLVNNVTFHNDGIIASGRSYNVEDEHYVMFDFTSQNITVPSTIVFAYHDNGALDSNGSVTGENELSVGLTTDPATVGSNPTNYFITYPNSAATDVLTIQTFANIKAEVTVVPLPASLWSGLALLAGIALVGGAKQLRRVPA
ncbi:MAG: hypothetical protein ACTHN5_04025 [Phycisphaerae bacterium]